MGYPKAGRAGFWLNLCKRGASLQCRRSWTHGEYRKGSHQKAISAMLPEFLLEPTRKIGTSARPIAPHRSLIIRLFVGKRCAQTLWDTAYLPRISLNGGPIFGAQTLVLPSSLITRITSNRLTVSCPDNMISFSAKCSHRMVLRRRICLARLLIRFRCGLLVFVSFDLHF